MSLLRSFGFRPSDDPERRMETWRSMTMIKIILGAALLGALFLAGWNVYRQLPADGTRTGISDASALSEMTIILRSDSAATPANPRAELYPIDFPAPHREYSSALGP